MHFKYKGINRLKTKGWEKICCANTDKKKAGVVISIPDKVCFRAKNVTKYKERVLNVMIIE